MLSDSGGVSSIIHTSGGSSDAIGGTSDQVSTRLQRQKVGSRKTFKFRKTRKDVSIFISEDRFLPLTPCKPVKNRIDEFYPLNQYC